MNENLSTLNQRPLLKTSIPGPKSQRLRLEEDQFIADGLQGFALMSGIAIEEGMGSKLTDVDGNEFLDVIGGIGVGGIGHSHPEWVKAIADQARLLSVGSFTTKPRVELFKKILEEKRGELSRVQLYSSGAEAVESALRLAKNKTLKTEFVSFQGGFHGKTHGVLGLMGSDFKSSYGPFPPGNHIIPYASCYRCPVNSTYPRCGLGCLEEGKKHLKRSVKEGIAAFIVEPVQGTAGNIVPPKEFLSEVKKMAKEFDALFISDEMITGFGRTGEFWGSDHSETVPDIMTIGKQFGGGFPVSGLITTEALSQTRPWGNPSGSSSSYGGNPLAASAALAALSVIKKENLVKQSRENGLYFLERLMQVTEKHRFVGEVHGLGMMLGMELVKNKETKEPLSKKACAFLFQQFLEHGLLTMSYSASFRLQPPMIMDRGTIDNVLALIKDVFDKADELDVRSM